MDDDGFADITARGLKRYIETHREKDYLLVDVRQPLEYEVGHIPGAVFIPLSTLETRLFDLPADRDLIFYCRNGSRSLTAASLAAEGEVTGKQIFNLFGGIFAFEGKSLTGIPRVRAFDETQGLEDLLYLCMDLEKGAWRFYRHLKEQLADSPIGATLEALSRAETAHARLVYHFWKKGVAVPLPFDALFQELSGEILEGGEALGDVLGRISRIAGDPCLDIIEIALHMEYTAYDLYRVVAGRVESSQTREALLSLAQAEKGHMRTLARAVRHCRLR